MQLEHTVPSVNVGIVKSVKKQGTTKKDYLKTRSLGAIQAPTSSWRPFGPLDFVLRAFGTQAAWSTSPHPNDKQMVQNL